MSAPTIDPRDIRASSIAGSWYPAEPRVLEMLLKELLARAELHSTSDELIALISPHAGYLYSGQNAAHAYRQLTEQKFERVIMLGPSHFEDFGAFAISAKKYYWTPFGEVELDQEFISDLAQKIPVTRVTRDREHSLEIQLPFLQHMLGKFKIVPIMLSHPFYVVGANALAECEQLAAALADILPKRPALIVVSSDLSHLYDYAAVKNFDTRFAELVAAFDIPALVEYMWKDYECRACGDSAIITGLLTAKRLGANRTHVLHLTNSGDVTDTRASGQYTVGYLAAAVYKSINHTETQTAQKKKLSNLNS
ncbi:MAG: AmmeMemoRadiSam system protein B [bacterium]